MQISAKVRFPSKADIYWRSLMLHRSFSRPAIRALPNFERYEPILPYFCDPARSVSGV
jgi:hypothetical protein